MKSYNTLKKNITIWITASFFTIPVGAWAAGNTVVPNDTLPSGYESVIGGHTISADSNNHTLNVTQSNRNGIIKWNDFSIGANAQVNFSKNDGGSFNTLNYVTGSNTSQIYGKMNAKDGNIYLINPNGVQIGNSAQINVGSLYVSAKQIDDTMMNQLKNSKDLDFDASLRTITTLNNAQLMSLGYVTANTVTFEGKRIVLDMDRMKTSTTHIVSIRDNTSGNYEDNRLYDIVLGSNSGDSSQWAKTIDFRNVGETDVNQAKKGTNLAQNPAKPAETLAQYFTYQWIHDGEELKKINDNLTGHYALRNAIDLTGTDQDVIGQRESQAFTGKFDGLGYNIFGLSITNTEAGATGLFGYTNGAIIGHVNLIAGTNGLSIIGGDYTGSLIGHAVNTQVRDVTSTLQVKGNKYVGGVIGYAKQDRTGDNAKDSMKYSILNNLINTGTIYGEQDVGGIVGHMKDGTLGVGEVGTITDEETHNLGKVIGTKENVGGLVGRAEDNAVIGGIKSVQKQDDGSAVFTNNDEAIYNASTIEGAYNVGGIVGSATNTTIQHVRNESTVQATGYTNEDYGWHQDKGDPRTEKVRMANTGGIVGAISEGTLTDAVNKGNISSQEDPTYRSRYQAGNVGGIAGKAKMTYMTNVTNQEANIRGAMNVGGIVGYYGGGSSDTSYCIKNGQNDGGDISATGGINMNGTFSKEINSNGKEQLYNTGNIGGIAGILDGSSVHIEGSVNRGNVHTPYVTGNTVPETAMATNIGGIVGKIDQTVSSTSTALKRMTAIKDNVSEASVSGSANTGNVEGYINIGGIAGLSFNGSIASSYNLGNITTTREGTGDTTEINLGGILGDSTEQGTGRVVLYDVYNKGQIGSREYTKYFGRHEGGIVGRLSGMIEKAYNTGDIYNGSNVVGGIVGYWYNGAIKNVFNTGNITVYNQNDGYSGVGGIIGAVNLGGGNNVDGSYKDISLCNMYNLGILRSYQATGSRSNSVGGIIGTVNLFIDNLNNNNKDYKMSIANGYTVGRLYAAHGSGSNDSVGAIVGLFNMGGDKKPTSTKTTINNLYYLTDDAQKRDGGSVGFITDNKLQSSGADKLYYNNGIHFISKDQKNRTSYRGLNFSTQHDGSITCDENTWRISEGNTLPMLNAFLPGSEAYFSNKDNWNTLMKDTENGTLQYGTEYNPLLTIIRSNTNNTLTFNWGDLKLGNNGSIAVMGQGDSTPGLTLNHMDITNPTGIFGGEIYTTGTLSIIGDGSHDMHFGGGSTLHAGSIFIDAQGKTLDSSGEIHAVGKSGHTDLGDIVLNGGEVRLYGQVKTSKDTLDEEDAQYIPGISTINTAYSPNYWQSIGVTNFTEDGKLTSLTSLGQLYSQAIDKDNKKNGDLTIHANRDVNILYGNQKNGRTEVGGNLYVTSDQGQIYMDSDYTIGHGDSSNTGKISFTSNQSSILDLTNIGGNVTGKDKAKAIQKFLTAHSTKDHGITANTTGADGAGKGDIKIAIDAWKSQATDKDGQPIGNFDYKQYDYTDEKEENHEFLPSLWNVSVQSKGNTYGNGKETSDSTGNSIHDIFYTFISNADQLNGIQHYAECSPYGPDGDNPFNILNANFLLKNDIDASGLMDAEGNTTYEAIARGNGQSYTGTFDGMGNRIIGLKAKQGLIANNSGTVTNMDIYSSVFTGENAGAIASKNSGTISSIHGLGNSITGSRSIGGLVGMNGGTIQNVTDQSTVIAGENTIAGGIAGTNQEEGRITNAQTNSATTTDLNADSANKASFMGGIAGRNEGSISNVSAHGITGKVDLTHTAGGIAGDNQGRLSEVYNESILHGLDGLGGIAGNNTGSILHVANAVEIIGDTNSNNVGGLVGNQQSGSIQEGRNTGTIRGGSNVGGMVGTNGTNSQLSNLENGSVAQIVGTKNVGGIAGSNEGTIIADDSGLQNAGEIYGRTNVGGIVGNNTSTGLVKNINSNVTLHIQPDSSQTDGSQAEYFGGVVGFNEGKVINAANSGNIHAKGASYVGGIIGKNTNAAAFVDADGQITNRFNNTGEVTGANFVGGIIGYNDVQDLTNIQATNTGNVQAKDGGAGGIFGRYTGNIRNSELYNAGNVTGGDQSNEESGTGGITGVNEGTIDHSTLTNTGLVSTKNHGTNIGGIFGIKTRGTITNSTLKNEGIVAGTENVGGLIGKNQVDISQSNLMNTVKGQVAGIKNVGGLIGSNEGTVSGGRDSNDGYYQYQVYNNGTVQVGAYQETTDPDGSKHYQLIATAPVDSQNIGGLIGDNRGKLSAAYNTGVIEASGSTNVGGIVGSNSGTVDQVFTNIMTQDDQNRTITGGTFVGGIVGSNTETGKVSNAYTANSTSIVGNTSGLIAGTNIGTISNVYGDADNAPLVGTGTGTVEHGYGLSKKKSDYRGFDFDTTWKIYEDHTNPLLKVFLTKATVPNDVMNNLTYTGQDQRMTMKDLLSKMTNEKDHTAFGDYRRSHTLLQYIDEIKNAGTYTNWLWSAQIGKNNTGDFNPNNLGYDFDVEDVTVKPLESFDYVFYDTPWDRRQHFRERRAELHFVDGGVNTNL